MGAADHLQVPRQHGLFNHHGIDLGDGTVAHYLEGRSILRSSIEEFCAGQTFSVIVHKNASKNGLTLRRAMSRLGEQRYNLLFNNCEHFANWCKTGRHRSNQIEDWLKKSSFGAMAIGQLVPAAFFIGLNILLKKGLADESSRENAKKAIHNLKQIRENLFRKLESTLLEMENWINTESQTERTNKTNQIPKDLLLKGCNLADQLNTVESLETEIISLLNKTG